MTKPKPEQPKAPLTPEQFATLMREAEGDDCEAAHGDMDDIMCELLCSLGYEDGVESFRAQRKWYA